MSDDRYGGRNLQTIFIGGIWASSEPSVVRTVLGSCVAVCLRDPALGIGGMNHFMLPTADSESFGSSRYGVHAMELLINRCMERGADRRRLEAKVFGGGHVLNTTESDCSVPKINIEFALHFLEFESIPIASRDLGGRQAREVIFFTDSGRVLLRRLTRFDERTAPPPPAPPKAADDNITLF